MLFGVGVRRGVRIRVEEQQHGITDADPIAVRERPLANRHGVHVRAVRASDVAQRAEAAGQRKIRDRLEIGKIAVQAGEIAADAQFSSEYRIAERVLVVQDRMNDGELMPK